MDDENLEEALHKLRQRQAQRGGRWRFRVPKAFVPRIVAFVQDRQQQGLSLAEVSRRLGIAQRSLKRWLAQPPAKVDPPPLPHQERLRPVVLAQALSPKELSGPPRPSLCLRSPSGYEVSGLCLEQIVQLLRRLG